MVFCGSLWTYDTSMKHFNICTVFCILIDAYFPIFKVFIKQLNNVPIPYSWLISVPVTSFIVYTLHLLTTCCWSNGLSRSITNIYLWIWSRLFTLVLCSTPSVPRPVFAITEKAPTRAFSWLKAPVLYDFMTFPISRLLTVGSMSV